MNDETRGARRFEDKTWDDESGCEVGDRKVEMWKKAGS
jgi:hypothetical protein